MNNDYRRVHETFHWIISTLEGDSWISDPTEFTNTLKEEIKNEMRLIGPKSLDDAMELGVQIEAKKKWDSTSQASY